MGRAPCCDKANVKKGPWSPEEDAKLKAYIEEHGTGGNWIALPQKIGLKRCGKSCRLRWLNYLRPNIKHGGFSEEEDNIICSLYISIGSRWSVIAAQLPGRTDNDIKNYWNTRLKKKLLGRRKQSNNNRLSSSSDPNNVVEENTPSQTLSNSALERFQLHMQLQGLQNPVSFFSNNPQLLPKLHPQQEKLLLQSMNIENPNSLIQQVNGEKIDHTRDEELGNSVPATLLNQNYSGFNTSKVYGLENSFNNNQLMITNWNSALDSIVTTTNAITEPSSNSFQSELEELIKNKTPAGFVAQEDQNVNIGDEFDCFRAMNGTGKESLIWWNNEFDNMAKTSSSNSWDSQEVGFQDNYDQLGYNM